MFINIRLTDYFKNSSPPGFDGYNLKQLYFMFLEVIRCIISVFNGEFIVSLDRARSIKYNISEPIILGRIRLVQVYVTADCADP